MARTKKTPLTEAADLGAELSLAILKDLKRKIRLETHGKEGVPATGVSQESVETLTAIYSEVAGERKRMNDAFIAIASNKHKLADKLDKGRLDEIIGHVLGLPPKPKDGK